ncbi:MarR family transcriptional regulator [Geodermatophilus sp. DSM 44513]|uniref:MarR family winged helix-turn-helix transcriptional regulator n=1 Tax=Geodermatophilus sp. DSM 44513 TaxID=1528104 RepID=UPI0012871328|nr:MarR family transcriptional regulator [Geodermatophilus sp. DSM 44513]WNV75757.1 MarR family transcriptional regulator [Geodermatophilus sp. DSM 44513]
MTYGQAALPPDPADRVQELTRELMRRMVALAGELITSTGLNTSDLAALRALDAAAGDGTPVNTLGAQLGLSSGAVTALVDRLERHGLVRRERDTGDRRRVLVVLAPAARALGAERMVPLARRLQAATAELDAAELAAVERFLHAVLDDPGH